MRTLAEIYSGVGSGDDFTLGLTNFKFFTEHVIGWRVMPFHEEWVHMALHNRRVAIQAPTGFGKTCILGVAFCLWTSVIEREKEMCIVSKSLNQSTKVLSSIKDTIENNEYLIKLIPGNRPAGKWCSATMMELSTQCKIFCRPYSENIKGIHVHYLLGDEIASYDDPSIWHRFVVTRTNAKNGVVVGISTPDNIADLMQELQNNAEYISRTYPCIIDGKSIWPEYWPMEKLRRIKNEIGLAAFEREYMCNAKAEAENALYPPHLLTECFSYDLGFRHSPLDGLTIIACDFAIASGPRADFDSYTVVNKFGAKATLLHGECHRGFTIAAKVARLEELYWMYKKKLPDSLLLDVGGVGVSSPSGSVPSSGYGDGTGTGVTISDGLGAGVTDDDFFIDKPILTDGTGTAPDSSDDSDTGNSLIKFVIDPSNVGKAVYEALRGKGYPVECAQFDAFSRNAMLINLRQMIENKDLIIPRNKEDALCMTFTDKMIKELISMVETKTKAGQISYQSKAAHDDCVMSLAMGCHGAAQQREFLDMMAY